MLPLSVILLSSVLLLAMVLNLVLKPVYSARLTTACMGIAVIGGLFIYGIGYMEATGDFLLSVIRTPLSVIRMFVGSNELSAISDTTPVNSEAKIVLFWILHTLAFYSMASAAMFTLGAEVLRSLRLLLSRRGDMVLIFGIHENSMALGRDCLSGGNCSVVFVAETVSDSLLQDLNNQGMSVLSGGDAVNAEKSFLRRLHLKKRKLTVYALDEKEDHNLTFALKLKDALEKAGIPARNTALALPGEERILAPMLQASEEAYGFGYVFAFDEAMLVAREMIRLCPPWETIRTDPSGRAADDFACVVIGFGRYGQAVLRQFLINGQFAGSTFHATVFDPDHECEAGYFLSESPEVFRHYSISFYAQDGRSRAFYEFLEQHLDSIRQIAVCTGSEQLNAEISGSLLLYLKDHRAEHICVLQCGRSEVRYQKAVGSEVKCAGIYTKNSLSPEKADGNAVLVNAAYDSSPRTDWEKWVACSSFDKMSSRASAEFIPAYLRLSGSSRQEVLDGQWEPENAVLESLAETEHLRWMAFHFVMGYSPMKRETLRENAALFARCQAEGKPCPVHLTRDRDARLHACLVPWEELDGLSADVQTLTGRDTDYKQYDRNNVLLLPKILQKEEGL